MYKLLSKDEIKALSDKELKKYLEWVKSYKNSRKSVLISKKRKLKTIRISQEKANRMQNINLLEEYIQNIK